MEKTKEQLVEELSYQAQAIEEKDKKIAELEEKVTELEHQVNELMGVQDRRINELNELIGLVRTIINMRVSEGALIDNNFNSLLEKITK